MTEAKRILRVFPRRTKATPTDDLAVIGDPGLFTPAVDEVHVSCTFTWDRAEANHLVKSWARHYPRTPVRLGGPAFDDHPGPFVPGRYLAEGYTITSRGCPNRCPYCMVPIREGPIRTLEIHLGRDVLDNNLLACPDLHVGAVIDMLGRQKGRVSLTGGLEARRFTDLHAELIASLGPKLHIAYTALDRPGDDEHVQALVDALRHRGLRRSQIGCYVLVGHGDDTPPAAESRCRRVLAYGALPMAMYYRGVLAWHTPPPAWRSFTREWANKTIVGHKAAAMGSDR